MKNITKKIKQQILEYPIILYMKGTPDSPSCGFSSKAASILSSCCKKFMYIDVLQNPDIRVELPKISNWPTYPQLWIKGNLIGGCDIILSMYRNGELQKLIDSVVCNTDINK